MRFLKYALAGLALILPSTQGESLAGPVGYDLVIARQAVNFTGTPVQAMAINGTIPGPVLRFKQGDTARIRVENKMDVETSIHWHGLLVPPGMDGVPYLSFTPIRPGAAFVYEFPVRQSGTYWYHSHSMLQEQSGVYGAIVIEPSLPRGEPIKEHVILFSDWTDEDPHAVNRTLRRGSDWYAQRKGNGANLADAARQGRLGDYFKNDLQRMPPMDISDVAYNRFLANGSTEMTVDAAPHKTVKLRIIDGSATTFFHLAFAGGPMTIISADGQDVEPVPQQRLLVAVAETYDLVVTVPGDGAYEFRATAQDGSGHVSVWVGAGPRHPASDVPRPDLYHVMGGLSLKQVLALTPTGAMGMPDADVQDGRFDRPGMMAMGAMENMDPMPAMVHDNSAPAQAMPGMEHSAAGHATMPGMDMPPPLEKGANTTTLPPAAGPGTKQTSSHAAMSDEDLFLNAVETAVDGQDARRPWPPYDSLRSVRPTAFSKDRPVREIRLTLDGDMERYIWMLNNTPFSESAPILIREGEVVRLIMINRTMMHHPMHLHGHFFRIINGQGDYAPLKHTVNVAPMSTTVIEFAADEPGDWFFHCHLLYHMENGMAQVVHYDGYQPDPEVTRIQSNLYKDTWAFWGQADVMTNMTQGRAILSGQRYALKADWEAGWQHVDGSEGEAIVTGERHINRFFSLFTGINFGDALESDRAVLGIRYLLPFNLETSLFKATDGGTRVTIEKNIKLTERIGLAGQVQYEPGNDWEGHVALSYLLSKNLSLVGQWHSDYGLGAGMRIRF